LNDESFYKIYLPIPPLDEQVLIASQISERTQGIEIAMRSVETEIELLREYRTRLVSDVVTGKIDVRSEASRLPEVDPLELAEVASGSLDRDEDVEDAD
jgi:type I restriction enzyme S subunit